jgi:hypothetical protein
MNAIETILNPGILFFILGLAAALLRSNLAIPDSVVKFLSFYLMLSIGFKGGVSLHHSTLWGDGLIIIAIIIFMSALVPLYTFFLLRRRVGATDAAAIGATYGSNSTLTYITAAGFLTATGVSFGGYMTVALVVMETPAIIFAIVLARHYAANGVNKESLGRTFGGALTDGTILLLVGSMIIGYFLTATGSADSPLSAFISGDMFTGMLIFFLLYMGTKVGKKIRELKAFPVRLAVFAIVVPFFNASLALLFALYFKFQPGDTLLLMVLCSSASYIVAPAILREALPSANPANYLTMSMGITFPLNIIVGIPLYWWLVGQLL